jgi:hypothetical protein
MAQAHAEQYSFYGLREQEVTLLAPEPPPNEIGFDYKLFAHRIIDAIAADKELHAKLRIALECRP